MTTTHVAALPNRRSILLTALAGMIGLSVLFTAIAAAQSPGQTTPKPTVVLVHGAFADASGWNGVIERLQRAGYPVLAPANPLRGLASDSAYIKSVLDTISGPIILVGHSYGGSVITNAATGNPNVKALVFVAAFAPAPGESMLGLAGKFPGSQLPDAIYPRPITAPDGSTGVDTYIQIDKFREVFAADSSEKVAAAMAVSQRPAALVAGQEPSVSAALTTIPSWYLIPRQDHTIPPAVQQFMAERAGAKVSEINGSHTVMISHPGAVFDLIKAATSAVD